MGRHGTGRGEGCGARSLALRVDTEPVPDLELPLQARGNGVNGFKAGSNQCELELVLSIYVCSSLITH